MRRMSRRMIISERHNPNSLCNLPAYTHVHMALYLLLDLGATNAYKLLESSSSSHRSSLHSCTISCRSGMTNIEPAETTDRLGYTTSRGCRRMCCSTSLGVRQDYGHVASGSPLPIVQLEVTGCTGPEPESWRSRNREKGAGIGGREGGKKGSSETKTALLCRRLCQQRCRPLPKSWGSNVQRQRQGRANPNLAKTIGAKDNHLPVLLHCLNPLCVLENGRHTTQSPPPPPALVDDVNRPPKPPTLMNPTATPNTQCDPTVGPRTSFHSS